MFKRVALAWMIIGSPLSNATQMLDKVVAVVNDSVITSSELNAQVSLSKKQIQAQKMQVPEEAALRKQVLQHLIDVDLQMQLAKQNGVVVDNADVNQAIEKIATTNNIQLSTLREEITKQGMSWEEYRNNIRKEMILARLQQKAVSHEVSVTNEQVEQYLKVEQPIDKTAVIYHVMNIVVPLSEEPSSQDVKKALSKAQTLIKEIKHGADFQRLAIEHSSDEMALEGGDLGPRHLAELPELFAKEVVHLKPGEIAGPLRAGNGFQIIKLVAIDGGKQHHSVTLTHVRHILLKPDASILPAEAIKQVNNLCQQLQSGKDFALMAKQYSLDSGSAVKGGDLGWVGPGELVPEFEKTMNQLPLNKISEPVKSQYGWHIIQVLARKDQDDSKAFKKQQVRQFLQQRKFAEAVQDWQQHLRANAYINIIDKSLA